MSDMPQVLTPNTWPVGTEVVLMQVPWDANYRDVVVWDSQKERDEYFDGKYTESKRWTSKQFSYLPPNEPINIPVPYSAAYKYNYVVVQNPMQPVVGEEYPIKLCYFITSTTYINPQTTMITLQLDVIQTYQFGVQIDRLYAVSGHAAISNKNTNNPLDEITGRTLRKYFDIDEGISVGNTYSIVGKEWFPFTDVESKELGWVIVTSTANLAADPGSINSPNLNVADGQMTDGLPSACNVYSMEQAVFKLFMEAMQEKSWVAQCIVSVTTFPKRLLSKGKEVELFGNTGIKMNFIGETDSLEGKEYIEITKVYEKLFEAINEDYALRPYKKLLCYPYSVIELTSYSGNSIFIRPELLYGNSLTLYAVCCAIAPFARVAVIPKRYNCVGNVESVVDDDYQFLGFDGTTHRAYIYSGDFLDTALWLTDFPQFSIVNNNYITYMASTANTRAYQYSSAAWSLDKSNMGAQNAYNNAMFGADTTNANFMATQNGLVNALGQQALGTSLGDPSSALFYQPPTNVITGNMVDIVAGATGANVPNAWANSSNWLSNLTGATQNANNVNLARQVAGNNLNLANQVNQGDYENTIRGINAAYQDAQLTPPSTAGQLGGNGFNWKNGLSGFGVIYKQACGAAFNGACDYMLRYGNQIRRYININGNMTKLKVMKKFSYWKASETYIDCAKANEAEKDVIRGILERGVTIWGNPEDIKHTALRPADYDEYNAPLYNIEY